jgi:thiosulfate/3-mercaptopyruvate sulfurtransferase
MTGRNLFGLLIAVLISGCSGNIQFKEHNKLVTTDWLQSHLNDTSLALIYVGSRLTFDSIHIPNSQYIPVRDLLIRTDSLRNELPEVSKIDSLLESVGINDHSLIVLCYENDYMIPAAARLFLTLDYTGLGNRTYVLNGGLVKWVKEDRLKTDSLYAKSPGEITPIENNKIIVSAFEVEKYMNNPDFVIIDARPIDTYIGQFDSIDKKFEGGHIEGSISLPFDYLLSDTLPYMFKNDAELMKEFETAGMNEDKTAVIYCSTGIIASVSYLVSTHLGYKTLFYDGSFEDWEKLKLPVIKPVTNKSNNN